MPEEIFEEISTSFSNLENSSKTKNLLLILWEWLYSVE